MKYGQCALLSELVSHLESLRKSRKSDDRSGRTSNGVESYHRHQQHHHHHQVECVALNISPEMGERIMISGDRGTLEEMFPEIGHTLQDARPSLAWNSDSRHVIRFPLNGYCKVTSVQVIGKLLNSGFKLQTSNGGGVEGQQFSEYLFARPVLPQ